MRIVACLALLLALAASLAAQDKIRWRRVYTYSDAVIDLTRGVPELKSSYEQSAL